VNSPNCLLKSNIQPQKREILEGNAGDGERKRKDNRKTCMVVGMGGGILGCDGIADIIDVAYDFELGASRLMRWKWWRPEALENISQSGVRLDNSLSMQRMKIDERPELTGDKMLAVGTRIPAHARELGPDLND
jgi:hypothetical protein